MSVSAKKRLLLGGYFASLQDASARKRYQEKLTLLGGFDPYETAKSEWHDDVDLWPSITHIHLGMYLLYSQSPYTGEELLNYKSLVTSILYLAG